MDKNIIMRLINTAKESANSNFCCGYSNYTVGAALLTNGGKVYKGFNVENDGIQSICAERTTFVKALTEQNKEFKCIAVVGKPLKNKEFIKTTPCGYCRQFISEYVKRNKDFKIYTYDDKEEKIYEYTIGELLPEGFIDEK